MPWVRSGECKRCGRCCHLANLLKAPALKGTQVSRIEGVVCKHLKIEEDGTATCTIFDQPNRPLACTLHPSSPDSLTEGCEGYYFIWVD